MAKNSDEKIISWEENLANLVSEEWSKGRQFVSDLDDLYEDLYRMIRGERPEKNYDWQSNVVINKVFQVVWTAIPYITQKIFGADPVIGISSADKKGAYQRETILQFWNTMQPGNPDHTPYFLTVVMWTLRALLNGVGIVKKGWHQKTEQRSKEVEFALPVGLGEGGTIETKQEKTTRKTTVPVEDWPVTEIINNKDIVFDWRLQPSDSIRKGRFVTHRSVQDLASLYESKINYMNLDELDKVLNQTSDTDQEHADLKGKDDQDNPPQSDFYTDIEVYERQGILCVFKDSGEPCFDKELIGSDEVTNKQMVVTIAKAKGSAVLIRYEPNKAEEMTYLDMHIYFDSERWNSIGLIEPFKDIQTALNDNINAMFDEIWQNLMPPVMVNKFALVEWDTMQYAPAQRWLVGGNPAEAFQFKQPSNITSDAWQKHILLDSEIQLTSAVTPPMQGAGREKAATTNVLNAQMSAGKLDFVVKMIEVTALVPDAQMNVRLAKKFAHKLTFETILGEPFNYIGFEEQYKYVPAASSVKLEHQKQAEVLQDIQLMQTVQHVPNPNTPKILNGLMANILRNRNMPKEAMMFDEEFFEPQSEAGNMQILQRQLSGSPSNQNDVPISQEEEGVRRGTFQPRGLPT